MSNTVVALDVGEKRIGVAQGDTVVRIAIPYETVDVDGDELTTIARIILDSHASTVVVGYPRNQSGEVTAQTAFVEAFVDRLNALESDAEIIYQDESLTSVLAEQRLIAQKWPYSKADIDMHAASIILEDYLERRG